MADYETMNAGRVLGVPIRVHYTLILGALVGLALHGFRIVMALGSLAGYLVLVLAHELGHSLVGRLVGARTVEIVLFFFGGECRLEYRCGRDTPLNRALVAWGGVLAQGVILAVTWLFVACRWIPDSELVVGLVFVFHAANVVLIVFNLLPIGRLDGRAAWTLPLQLLRELRARRAATRVLRKATRRPSRASEAQLRVIEGGRGAKPR